MNFDQDYFVEVRNLTFGYPGRQPVLKGYSLNIPRGQITGITGPSGCGKSTLARIIAGFEKPTGGDVMVDGRNVTGRPQRDVFLVHQGDDLFPWLTVEKQIASAMTQKDPERLRELLELTKLTGFEKAYPHQLSGGMQKRLSIARALAVNPKLMIFDESFAALDFDLRREIFEDLKRIWARTQMTILLVTHDPRDLKEISQVEINL